MSYKGPGGITILEGLEVVRRRPTLYLGEDAVSLRIRLVEALVFAIVEDTPAPSAVRISMWIGGAFTVAFDGTPLPIAPSKNRTQGIPHPELYDYCMYLSHSPQSTAFGLAITNALCDRFVVSTVHEGIRYRAAFGKGALISLLSRAHCEEPLGSNWLTFAPDASLIPGEFTPGAGHELARRSASPTTAVSFTDRSSEEADWW